MGYKKGHPSWNKGLTKETDERIRKYSEKLKGKIPSEKSRIIASLTHKGKIVSKETRKKQSNSHKGKTTWNKGIKGYSTSKRGKTYEELFGVEKAKEIKQKLRKAHLGMEYAEETKEKKRIAQLNRYKKFGFINSPETRKKLSIINKGRKNPHTKEWRKLMSKINGGKNNPMYGKRGILAPRWKGGIQFEPYDKSFNNKFKRAIRKRDNYVCLKCGKHQEKENRALSIHHINYDKLLSIKENCCALCRKCHSETNTNREHWTKFFQSILSKKYDYEYSEKGEIIMLFGENKSGRINK